MAINGYDDGASTGEVRRFLGDSLGPSDFRKNASRLASMLRSCSPALIEIVDSRLPAGISRFESVDLGDEACCDQLIRIFREENVRAVVHLAFVIICCAS